MAGTTLHLRSECKPLEHRSALTPTIVKALLDAGYTVNAERSPERIFEDSEFSDVGATLVPEGSWPTVPTDHIIVGLKELPEEDFPLKHTHVQFAHCYKRQAGWDTVLRRFTSGGGTLLDLEFLTDESGRRVAAFGYHAGFAGAALAIAAWAWSLSHPPSEPLPGVKSYPNVDDLLTSVKESIASGTAKNGGKPPRVLVIGALGRCGKGAVELCVKAGLPEESIVRWDLAETARGGPFPEILASDIFVNCIYLTSSIPPFVSPASIASTADRKLRVVCDVSCDTTNPHNPIPIYSVNTTFSSPTVPVDVSGTEPPLSVISIDHLPSMLPREASEAFAHDLLPSLLSLAKRGESRVWREAEALFEKKVGELPAL
ncbi:MAG: Saccharopine dehydrogenase [Thelocarpon impressellum]|nr:MAG: Saccharopine dehydrogenase [Thelocarpon impressellum]